MNSAEVKVERGLILYLRELGIEAISAKIGESEVEKGWEGCETCGYGGAEDEIYTPIYYRTKGDRWNQVLRVEGKSSIGMLHELLDYIERAN